MPAGPMRDFVSLMTQVPTTDPRWGPGNEWQRYAQVWANIVPAAGTSAGTEQFITEGVQTEVLYLGSMRYRTDVKSADRMIYRGMTLELVSTVDPDGKRDTLAFQAKQYNGVQ